MNEGSERYILRLEPARERAGWGRWFWIIDTWAEEDNQLVALVAEHEADGRLQQVRRGAEPAGDEAYA